MAATLAGAWLAWGGVGAAVALQVPPAPTRRVNDYAGALAAADVDRLERQLAGREGGNTNQVAVAVFRSLEGESLEDFSVRLAERWRIGQKGQDNGVIFLVFVDDRKMRIEVGYGLESTLTDAVAAAILRNDVAPRFREGRVADGIAAGLTAIDKAIAGQYEGRVARPSAGGLPWPVTAALAGFGVFGAWTGFMAWSRRRRGFTSGRSGWVTPGRRDRDVGGWGPWFGGGGGGWSSSGGGGDSGFSGGGGDFGGGGASGDW